MSKLSALSLMFFVLVGCTQEGDNEPNNGHNSVSADAAAVPGSGMTQEPDSSASVDGHTGTAPMDAEVASTLDGGTNTRNENCVGLCGYLDRCGSCFFDPQGECLDITGCVEVCEEETAPTVAACIARLDACSEAGFQGCFDANIGDDACADTCRFLEDCGQCFADDNGDCLSLASCAIVCRESTPPAAAACIATLTECEGIEGCYQ